MSNLKLVDFAAIFAPDNDSEEPLEVAPLQQDGGDDSFDGMDRVTRLEEQMAGVRDDLRDIKDSLRVLPTLPTKRDLTTNNLTAAGLALAVVAIIVAGLGWLETRASRVAGPAASPPPIIIQMPTQPLATRATR